MEYDAQINVVIYVMMPLFIIHWNYIYIRQLKWWYICISNIYMIKDPILNILII